jgi:hypothetical protein
LACHRIGVAEGVSGAHRGVLAVLHPDAVARLRPVGPRAVLGDLTLKPHMAGHLEQARADPAVKMPQNWRGPGSSDVLSRHGLDDLMRRKSSASHRKRRPKL